MHQILLRELILYIDGNKSRLKCLSGMIISLMTGSSIYQKGLALGIVGDAKISSKTHRIYRFLKEFTFDYMKVASLILSFFCIENYVVAIDRTNWKFGKSDINILFLVIIIGKISVPVYWKSLPHGGVCSGELMEEFLQKFIKNLGVEKIKYLIADREFMNKEWLNFLINNHIKFAIPLKRDNKIRLEKSLKTLSIVKIFNDLKALEYKVCSGVLWDKKVNFAAYKNDKSELMVLVSSIEIEVDIFALYRYRWSIERLFKHLKSGGFDIEKSHLVNLDRFEKLLVVAAITSALIIKNGLIQNALNPIRIKSYKTIEKQLFSLFTYGFDYIKNAFYQSIIAITHLIDTLLLPPKKELFSHSQRPITKIVGYYGRRVKAYVFNMRLSYSRLDYYEVVFDQSCQTWIQCHINAFNYFAGSPKVIKLDNLKAGVVDSNFYEPVYQKEYKRLADHYGILLSPCRVYQPQEKGKVESGIKYVKNNFFAGRKFHRYEELTHDLANWLNKANNRIHGTTKKIPKELFEQEESNNLMPLPLETFDLSSWHNRKVAKDCHITIDNNYYSVPAKYIYSDVLVQLSPKLVQIFSIQNDLIARHLRADGKGIFTTNPSHYAKYKRLCPGFIEYSEHYQQQMQQIGNNCSLLLELLQQTQVNDWQRCARGIISLRKVYNDDLIDKACHRALHYGISSYSKIKNILNSNAVNLPLPEFGGKNAELA